MRELASNTVETGNVESKQVRVTNVDVFVEWIKLGKEDKQKNAARVVPTNR